MKMDYLRKDGYNMYTKLLRMIVKMKRKVSGHCDGSSGGSGHCI